MHRNMARTFVHDLDMLRPSTLSQFPLSIKLGKLRFVVRVRNGPGTQTIPNGKTDVVRSHDLADLVPMGVEKIFLMVRQTPFGQDRSTARDDAGGPSHCHRDVP